MHFIHRWKFKSSPSPSPPPCFCASADMLTMHQKSETIKSCTAVFIPFTLYVRYHIPRTTKLLWGILVSLRPSVCPSVRPASIPHPSRIPCPLCSFYISGWIHFIFIHLIKQLQKVCRVQSFLQNFKIWSFGNFLRFVTLTLCCFDLGSDVNH